MIMLDRVEIGRVNRASVFPFQARRKLPLGYSRLLTRLSQYLAKGFHPITSQNSPPP
jgi:hypothetical protein